MKYDLHLSFIIYYLLPQNTNFCMKNHQFRMTLLEKYTYCSCKKNLDTLIGRKTADMYQIFKEKKYELSTFDPF